ncbi:MAG TPA: BON domain-containing protein [Pyrinomonadaceae bacterium]|jgi:osmotically-inducible protein OsmY
MSTRYGDRGFGRYGDPEEDRTEDREFDERDTARGYGDASRNYGEAGERYGREYGAARRGGGYAAGRGGEYGRGRESDARDYFARESGSRYGSREYGAGEYPPRYGREGTAPGGYAGSAPRRAEGEEYGRAYPSRAYGRDAGRDYERGERGERARPRRTPGDEEVRDYDTDYGRTTSRFYGRSGYEYGREDYDRDDDERGRRAYAERGYAGGGDERGGSWLDRAADQVRSWFGGDEDAGDDRREEMRARGVRGEGKFRGRGPKNYRRSEERVREEVCDRLTDNEWLDASEVEVSIAAGEVILTGVVDSRYAKRLAENIAESVAGVSNVQNNLRVHSYQQAETGALASPAATPALTSDVTATAAAPAASEPDLGDPLQPGHSSSRAAGGS